MLDKNDPSGWPSFTFFPTEETQVCPSCGAEGPHSPRHSPYICLSCARRVTDKDGNKMVFADMNWCRLADADPEIKDTWRMYSSNEIFVLDERRVDVFDGRFGGYVVQHLPEKDEV